MKINVSNHTKNIVIENSNNTGKWQAKLNKNAGTKKWEIVFSKREKASSFFSKVKDFMIGASRNRNKAAEHLQNLSLTKGLPSIKDSTKGKITNQSLDNYINAVISKAGNANQLHKNNDINITIVNNSASTTGSEEENILIIDKKIDSEKKSFVGDLVNIYCKGNDLSSNSKKEIKSKIEAAISFINGEPTLVAKDNISSGIAQLKLIHFDAGLSEPSISDADLGDSQKYSKENKATLRNLIKIAPDLSDPIQKAAFDKKFQT